MQPAVEIALTQRGKRSESKGPECGGVQGFQRRLLCSSSRARRSMSNCTPIRTRDRRPVREERCS